MAITNQDVLHTLNQRARSFQKSMNNQLKEHGVFASQWSILFCLHQFGAMTQTEIWRYLHVEAPTVTRTLAKMEQNGWVIRTQGKDKREWFMELTPKAKEQFPSVQKSVQELENNVLENLTDEEKKQLYHLLFKIKG